MKFWRRSSPIATRRSIGWTTGSRPNDLFFARGAYDNRFRPDPEFFPGFVRDTGLKAYNIVVRYTRIWTPSVIQEIRASYNRSYIYQSDPRENTDFNIERTRHSEYSCRPARPTAFRRSPSQATRRSAT